MSEYKAPLKNINFLINDVFNFQEHYAKFPSYEDASPDMVDAILTECAKFCENELVPINQSGDKQGCHFENGEVTTPDGFKEAYNQYVEGVGSRYLFQQNTVGKDYLNHYHSLSLR